MDQLIFGEGSVKQISRLTILLLTCVCMLPSAAFALTDGEAAKMSSSDLVNNLRTDLPMITTGAKRIPGNGPFMPSKPAYVEYFTRPQSAGRNGFCEAQRLYLAYDNLGNIQTISVQLTFGAIGHLENASNEGVHGTLQQPEKQQIEDHDRLNQECESADSSEFFSATDATTAERAIFAIQQITDDARLGVAPSYKLFCSAPTSPTKICDIDEQSKFLNHIDTSKIGAVRLVSCQNSVLRASALSPSANACLSITLNDYVMNYDEALVELNIENNVVTIDSVTVRHGTRVY